ncbi:hypothetical protein KY317_04200, partial [Candidatus Woesearchaeota archaeon]|nr:hypothetical protein [Candidatus Woesearchaeota archaeon]
LMHPIEIDLEVDGKEDKSIKEYVKVEFTKSDGFPVEVQQAFPQPIPVQLIAESPQKQMTIDLSCRFKTAGKEYAGEVKPKQSYTISGKSDPITVTCSSPYAFENSGQYYAIFEAKIDNIETISRLKRLFVGNERNSKRLDELRGLHSLETKEPSRGAEEFAAFAFGIGTPIETPIIKDQEEQPIIGNIINKADGFITDIKRISIELPEDIDADYSGCRDFGVYGNELVFENAEKLKQINLQEYGKDKKIPLLACFLIIPEELRNTEDATERSFKSVLEYSYKIEGKVGFKVMPSIIT